MAPGDGLSELIGESPGIVALREQARRLLERQSTARRLPVVLILGETGTGKGLLARAMHHASTRSREPFVSVNCAALPETLLESELFGYQRGAFSGANQSKPGLFEMAHRGTLFLDEIGTIPLVMQAKLLTAIEDRSIRRLGSTTSTSCDIWIIAATSENLTEAVRSHRFREDLYHRLAAITMSLPPLRERRADVIPLARHFLAVACAEYGQARKRLGADAEAALLAYSWPGNVRELSNLIERVAVLCDGIEVMRDDLGLPDGEMRGGESTEVGETYRPLKDSMNEFERSQLRSAWQAAQGNLSRTAAFLGVPRNTLRYRMSKYGLGQVTSRAASRAVATPRPRLGPVLPSEAVSTRPTRHRVILLWVSIMALEDSAKDAESTGSVEIVLEKVRTFGGSVCAVYETGLVAAFIPDITRTSPSAAVHAVLAIQRYAERRAAESSRQFLFKAVVHGAECVVDTSGDTPLPNSGDVSAACVLAQELARELEPGGVIISSTALPLLRDHFLLVASSTNRADPGAARLVTRTPAVSSRPSIAVLPFRNLTGDPDQEYFGDGITEDIVGGLSRLRWLFVVARSSTLMYKAHVGDVSSIAAQLGVRYLVTGTVRRAESRLRVTADLVDAERGNTIWAERYDGTIAEIFEVQDRITERVVGTLDTAVRLAEIRRAIHKRTESLDAYDCVLRALALIYRLVRPDFDMAGEFLERAIGLDSGFAAAYTWRAWWFLLKLGQGWSNDRDADVATAGRLAEAALRHDPEDAMALAVSGHLASVLHGQLEHALARFERSLALNPNSSFAWALSGPTFCYVGKPEVALERVEYAMRLSPFDPLTFYYFGVAGLAEMWRGRYEEATRWAMKCRQENPRFSANLRVLTICLAMLERLDEARGVANEFVAIESTFRVREFFRHYPLRDAAALERYTAALRRAGLPE